MSNYSFNKSEQSDHILHVCLWSVSTWILLSGKMQYIGSPQTEDQWQCVHLWIYSVGFCKEAFATVRFLQPHCILTILNEDELEVVRFYPKAVLSYISYSGSFSLPLPVWMRPRSLCIRLHYVAAVSQQQTSILLFPLMRESRQWGGVGVEWRWSRRRKTVEKIDFHTEGEEEMGCLLAGVKEQWRKWEEKGKVVRS